MNSVKKPDSMRAPVTSHNTYRTATGRARIRRPALVTFSPVKSSSPSVESTLAGSRMARIVPAM